MLGKTQQQSAQAAFDLEQLIFFQLIDWASRQDFPLEGYQELLKVAPRRKNLESKVWKRKIDSELVVLKSFNQLESRSVQRAILNELVIPKVVDHSRVLQPSSFFVFEQVTPLRPARPSS